MLDLFGPASAPGSVTLRPGETRTFGAADTFFRDCSSADLDDGTELIAAWFNQMLAVLRALARGNGQTAGGVNVVTEDNADDSLLLKAVQQLMQRGQAEFATDTGTVGHVVAAFTPAVAEHKLGQTLRIKIANTNTGAADFAPNGIAAKSITRIGGAALQPGDLQAGGIAELAYDGVQYQIISMIVPPATGSTQAAPKLIGISANATAGVTALPTSVATRVNFGTTELSNLGGRNSTWNGNTLTVGAGEAGLWFVSSCCHIAAPAGGVYCSHGINVNGSQVAQGSSSAGNSGDAQDPSVSTIIKTSVGDTIDARAYQQTGSTQNALNDNRTRFSAFLISAY